MKTGSWEMKKILPFYVQSTDIHIIHKHIQSMPVILDFHVAGTIRKKMSIKVPRGQGDEQ